MSRKGQIVEIPAGSPVYKKPKPEFSSKKEELVWLLHKDDYSLFDGFLIGEHVGTEHFQLGQRKGINAGGKKQPLYVIGIDDSENRIFVGAGLSHPGLFAEVFLFSEHHFHWNGETNIGKSLLEEGISVEISSTLFEEMLSAMLYIFDGEVFLKFRNPVSITIQNDPITIFYQNKETANIFNK